MRERLFGPRSSQEPVDKKPGLLERAKSRIQSYQEERQQKKFQAQLGGIASRGLESRANLKGTSEDRIAEMKQRNIAKQAFEKQQEELLRKQTMRERKSEDKGADKKYLHLLYRWLEQLTADKVQTPAEKEREILKDFNNTKNHLKVTSLRGNTSIGHHSETVREMLHRIFSDRAIIERILATLK